MHKLLSVFLFLIIIKGRYFRFILPKVPDVLHPPVPDDGKDIKKTNRLLIMKNNMQKFVIDNSWLQELNRCIYCKLTRFYTRFLFLLLFPNFNIVVS